MTCTSRLHRLDDPGEIARLLQLLSDATDQRVFCLTLQEALARLLPNTYVIILAARAPNEHALLLHSAPCADLAPPPSGAPADLIGWLGEQGYAETASLPLSCAGQPMGWLLLAQARTPIVPEIYTFAEQLAAISALRLLLDQSRSQLAAQPSAEQRARESDAQYQRVMVAGAAHDINNLLAAILGYAELLQQSTPHILHHDLQAISRASRDGQQILRRLLAASRPRHNPDASPLTLLPTIIRDAIKLTQPFWEPRADITVKTQIAAVPPVHGNATELREVLINLILNALNAMPSGGTLSIRSSATTSYVQVAISDTGEGIAPERQRMIFTPFKSGSGDGSGIGLSISRTIIEYYDGTLTVESAPGAGATFTITLPAIRSLETLHGAQVNMAASR